MQEDVGWDRSIVEVERNLNLAINKTTGRAPYEVLYGYLPRFQTDPVMARIVPTEQWTPAEDIQIEVRRRIEEEQQKQKSLADKKRYLGVRYEVGDVVFMRRQPVGGSGESTKLQPKFCGPLTITQILPSDTYRVASINEEDRRRFATTAHVSQLKGYQNHNEEDSIDEQQEDDGTKNEEVIAESTVRRVRKKPE
ncbi:uncharacterized protein [Onthophagus taurus]|uniref:uncharacterized protein n=1 Tax=Onthophagus taurus TaxID=166361 RepID=UPI0039BDFCC9